MQISFYCQKQYFNERRDAKEQQHVEKWIVYTFTPISSSFLNEYYGFLTLKLFAHLLSTSFPNCSFAMLVAVNSLACLGHATWTAGADHALSFEASSVEQNIFYLFTSIFWVLGERRWSLSHPITFLNSAWSGREFSTSNQQVGPLYNQKTFLSSICESNLLQLFCL